ncbi:MAG: S8 family peptidase [Streptosporangiales bacterium]|nr:S8 family peptidase [Streptosporangiales bacterium]
MLTTDQTPAVRRILPLALAAALVTLACAAPAAKAGSVQAARPAYSAPSGSWDQFTSELSSAGGVATGKGVTIAVLADGVATSGDGLSGKVTKGPGYLGKTAAPGSTSSGTVTASIILGSSGVVQGAAPDARILDMRVVPTGSAGKKYVKASGYAAKEAPILAKAITYAVAHGARVIEDDIEVNGGDLAGLQSAVSAAEAKGAVIVTGAWDAGEDTGHLYPLGLPGVIGVASTLLPGGTNPASLGDSSESANFSPDNNSVVIAGPGDWVQVSKGGWGPFGPSTSVPYVTSTVALIKQRYPNLAPGLVERALVMSAKDKPSGGYDTQVGFGVVDPYDAVLDAATLAKVSTSAAPGPGVAAPGTHFGSGPLPGPVHALPSALWQIILSCAGIVAGAALLAFAVLVTLRRRKARKSGGADETAETVPA